MRLLQRHPVVVAVAPAEELHQLDQQLAALGQRIGLEQRLLGGRIERGDLARRR